VAIATWKEMPVIPVNKVVHKNKIIGKGGLRRWKVWVADPKKHLVIFITT
jgi:hypothetical protein